MTGNPLSGHTAANHASAMTGSGVFTDSLEDGEHITSPSLTNMLEGVHGNGIMLEEDTAGTASIRDNPEDLPGVCEQVTNTHTVRIVGGHAVLDGVLYKFAGGPGSSQDVAFTTGSAHKRATYSALSSGQEVLIVVYISSDTTNQCITWEMGTPVTTASNTYPTTPSAFLSNPKSSGLDVKQSVVLAVVRAVYSASGGDLNLSITESNDKRVFVRPTPMYMSPVTSGVVGANTAVASHTALDAYNQDTGDLTASRFGALWQSYNTDGDAVLYYSAKDTSGTRHTHVLGPTGYVTASPSGTSTFTFNEGQVFVLNPSTAVQFNPTGTFPAGHTVYVTNDAAHDTNAITFDNAGIGMVLKGKESGFFVYTGSAWKNVMLASGAVSPNGHGANGLLQLSDGGGGFTSDTKLSWNSGTPELVVDGKLTVTGLIDPPGLVIDEKADIAATGHTTAAGKGLLWVKSDTPNRLYFTDDAGTDKKVIHATDSVTELTDVSAVGSGSIITTAERNKLTGIETGATGDQSNAEIRAAVEAATDSNVFTDSDHTKLNTIEASADVTDTANVVAALTAGTNVAIAVDGTISATDTNTEYTVGDGGLTQKNFTTTLKNKLDGIETSADVTDTANVVAALTAGTNVAIAVDGTISATDTNTEYTVGDGGLTQKNFTTTLKNKLDGIEASATADQTDAEIRAAVEAATDSNVFTDSDHTKLNTVETNADVTDATNVNAAGAVMESDVDAKGDIFVATADNTLTRLAVGTNNHVLTADSAEASGVKWAAASGGGGGAAPAIEDNSGTPAFATGITKAEVLTLLNVEDGADVTDTTNVTAAGALMDSEVTNLAQVKAFDSADYGPAIQIMKWTKTGSANITNLPHDIASGQKSLIDVGSVNWTEDTAGTTHVAIAISPDYGIQFLQPGIYRIDTGFYFQSNAIVTAGVICAMEATTSIPDPTQTGWLPSSYSINMGYNRLDVYISGQNLNSDPDFNMVFNINAPTTVYLFGEVANLSGGAKWRIRHHATAPLSQVTVTRIGDVQI